MNIKYLKLAIEEGKKAYDENEVPIGAVIVKNDEIISLAHNQKEKNKCSLEHAEMIAIREATKKLENWRLDDCDIYISLEPCPMCASAIKQSRIKNVYCALKNADENNTNIVRQIFVDNDINSSVNYYCDLMPEESEKVLKKFFAEKRKKNI